MERRVVILKETMGKIIVTDFVAKKVESLVKLLWETSIRFFIKTILQQPVCSTLCTSKLLKIYLLKFPKHRKKNRIWLF